jgi:hypothetical protein
MKRTEKRRMKRTKKRGRNKEAEVEYVWCLDGTI